MATGIARGDARMSQGGARNGLGGTTRPYLFTPTCNRPRRGNETSLDPVSAAQAWESKPVVNMAKRKSGQSEDNQAYDQEPEGLKLFNF